jgi:hypothetical protein
MEEGWERLGFAEADTMMIESRGGQETLQSQQPFLS